MMKSIVDRPPSRILRVGLRLPVLLYQLGLGWLLDDRFMLLIHRGRKSGLTHRTVVEVVQHDRQSKVYYAVSGWGERSDWYQNVRANSNILIGVGRRLFEARADFVPLKESISILDAYAGEHPVAFRELSGLFLGQRLRSGPESARWLAEKMPMVAFWIRQAARP
jgi:deazaflavin-dependent oxidoreductase (nitroreductase family)